MRNNPEWFDLVFACAAGGFVYVPVDYMLRPAEVLRIIRDSEPMVLVFDRQSEEAVIFCRHEGTTLSHYACVDGDVPWADSFDDALSAESPSEPDEAVGDDDLFLIQYTSGTTGIPKGVMHTHSTVVWNTVHQIGDFRVRSDERWLCIPGLCWVAGLHDVTLATLWSGGHVFLRPSGGLTATRVLDEIETLAITKTVLVPTVLKRVVEALEEEPHELPSLECVITGGENIPVSLIERFAAAVPHVDVVQAYGLSEFPCAATILPPEWSARKAGSAGLPSSVADIRVVDDGGGDVAVGTVGEVIIRSPATMIGYWGRSEETANALRGDWLHTGDAGRWDEDGFLYITGRKKDMYISGGLNVYPAEVEATISRHPGIAEVAIVGVPDETWGEVGVAVVVPLDEAQIDVLELEQFCRDRLASFKIPKRWVISVERLPRTNSGKVVKSALRETIGLG
jgi:fatty-acyl-CoA synthase